MPFCCHLIRFSLKKCIQAVGAWSVRQKLIPILQIINSGERRTKAECFHTNELHQREFSQDNIEMGICDNFITPGRRTLTDWFYPSSTIKQQYCPRMNYQEASLSGNSFLVPPPNKQLSALFWDQLCFHLRIHPEDTDPPSWSPSSCLICRRVSHSDVQAAAFPDFSPSSTPHS